MSFNSSLHTFFTILTKFNQHIKNHVPITGNGINKSALIELNNRPIRMHTEEEGVRADQSSVEISWVLIEDLRKQGCCPHIVACGAITASTQVH